MTSGELLRVCFKSLDVIRKMRWLIVFLIWKQTERWNSLRLTTIVPRKLGKQHCFYVFQPNYFKHQFSSYFLLRFSDKQEHMSLNVRKHTQRRLNPTPIPLRIRIIWSEYSFSAWRNVAPIDYPNTLIRLNQCTEWSESSITKTYLYNFDPTFI